MKWIPGGSISPLRCGKLVKADGQHGCILMHVLPELVPQGARSGMTKRQTGFVGQGGVLRPVEEKSLFVRYVFKPPDCLCFGAAAIGCDNQFVPFQQFQSDQKITRRR